MLVRTDSSRHTLQIDSLDALAQLVAVANQVSKVLPGDLSLGLELTSLFSLDLELLDVALQSNANLIGWSLERSSNFGANTQGICVGVVESSKLGGEFCAQTAGQRFGDRGHDIGSTDDH